MEKLNIPHSEDNEGYDQIIHINESFMFEKRYFIVMDSLDINLYNYNKMLREKGQK